MEVKDMLPIFFERANAAQTLWTLYVTIILGLLAFIGSAKLTRPKLVASLLSIIFLIFAAVNLSALCAVTAQRLALFGLMCPGTPGPPGTDWLGVTWPMTKLCSTLVAPGGRGVMALHILGDLFTLTSVWFMILKRPKS